MSLREDVYDMLKAEKAEGESFSDVVERVLRDDTGEHPLSDLVGAFDEGERELVDERRRRFREDVENRV